MAKMKVHKKSGKVTKVDTFDKTEFDALDRYVAKLSTRVAELEKDSHTPVLMADALAKLEARIVVLEQAEKTRMLP